MRELSGYARKRRAGLVPSYYGTPSVKLPLRISEAEASRHLAEAQIRAAENSAWVKPIVATRYHQVWDKAEQRLRLVRETANAV